LSRDEIGSRIAKMRRKFARQYGFVGNTNLRNDEAILAGEFAPHLGDAGADLVAREEKRAVELLAEHKLDLERLELLLDRGARIGFGAFFLRRLPRRLLGAVLGE